MIEFGDSKLAAALVSLKKFNLPPPSTDVCWDDRYWYVCKEGHVFRTGNCGLVVRELAEKHHAQVWMVSVLSAVMLYDFTPKETPCQKASQ